MMTSPKVLTEDWITTLDREKRIPWNPAGRPMRRICRMAWGWSRIFLRSRCSGPVSFTMQRSTREAEMHWEITVAMATPATSSLQPMTKKRFSTMLTTPARERKYSGRWVSPSARSRAAPKL